MTSGSRPSTDTGSAGFELESFVCDLERLDRDLARLRVQRWAFPLGGPAADEVPAQHRLTAVSDSSPLADEKAAAAIPSISTMKLKTVYGSVRLAAEMRSA